MKTALSGAASVSAHSQYPTRNLIELSNVGGGGLRVGARIPEMATIEMQSQLPKLDDDKDIGKERHHTVRRDDQPDISFAGTLLASAAPEFRAQPRWREYRVYETKGGNLVLSRIGRTVKSDERDRFEAKVYRRVTALQIDEGKNYREDGVLLTWEDKSRKDVITEYFGFDDVAKELYRRLGLKTETSIN